MKSTEKSLKFERIAERRVSEVLNKLRLVGNLSDRRNYSYSEEHVKEIFDAIESELKATKSRFRSEEHSSAVTFSFKKRSSAK